MPTITMNNPLADGVNAVNDWAGQQQQNKAKALALARQKQKDDQEQSNADRTYRLQEHGSAREDKLADATVAHQAASDKILKDEDDRAKALAPFVIQAKKAEIAAAADASKAAALALARNRLQLEMDKQDAKNHPRAVQLANQLAQAQIGEVGARTNEANSQASRAAHENAADDARTAHENAETGLTEQYTRNLKAGLTKTGGSAGGHETYTGDFEKMSPQAQSWVQKLQSAVGDKRMTMGDALSSIDKTNASATDKHLMRSILGTPEGRMAMTSAESMAQGERAQFDAAIKTVRPEIADVLIADQKRGVGIGGMIEALKQSQPKGNVSQTDIDDAIAKLSGLNTQDNGAAAPTPAAPASGPDWGAMIGGLVKHFSGVGAHVGPPVSVQRGPGGGGGGFRMPQIPNVDVYR